MYTIAEIEDAIIAELKKHFSEIRTIKSINDSILEIEKNILVFPAILLAYTLGRYDYRFSEAQDLIMTFRFRIITRSLRGEKSIRHGSKTDIGAYEVLDKLRKLMTNNKCGLNIEGLLPVEERSLGFSAEKAEYETIFTTRARHTIGGY